MARMWKWKGIGQESAPVVFTSAGKQADGSQLRLCCEHGTDQAVGPELS
jgi:hypothetical protein